MWKVSGLFLLLIIIGNCSTYDTHETTVTESSRNARSPENPNQTDATRADYIEDSRPYDDDDDYTRRDTSRTEGGKLLGNWRNNGAAFEPKWRDGDSVPLVPFNAAKHSSSERHDVSREDTKLRDWESSHAVTKPYNRHEDVAITGSEESPEETIDEMPSKKSSTSSIERDTKNDRYAMGNDYETNSHYRTEYEREIISRGRKPEASKVLTDELRYETTEDADTSGRSAKLAKKLNNDENDDDTIARTRYRETFQVHPNEYELNDEEYQKPRPRKRRPPQHYEFSEFRAPTYSVTWSTEKYVENLAITSKPLPRLPEVSTRRKAEQKNSLARRDRNKASENAELKSLLKMQQTEGLSLSEILQRRNLTLNDLLKGKADVINVLKFTESNEDSTEFSSVKPKIFEATKILTTERPKTRIFDFKPNEVSSLAKSNDYSVVKNTSEVSEDNDESLEKLDSAETEDGQRKSNDNEKLSAIVRLTKPIILPRLNFLNDKPFISSTTTERVAEDSIRDYQNDQSFVTIEKTSTSLDDDEIMEFSDFTMKKQSPIATNSPISTTNFDDGYDEDSGSTLSIEHILGPTETSMLLPVTTQKTNIDNKVVNGAEASRPKDTEAFGSFDYQSDEPQEVPEDSESKEELPMGDQPYEVSTEKSEIEENNSDTEKLPKNHQIFSTSSKPYEVVVSEIEPDARAEIFELFSSGSSGKRLERLLKSRNMSIDELIALRQRGSSKVHMAEVLRSKETLSAKSREFNANNQAVDQTTREEETLTTESSEDKVTADDLSDIEIDRSSESMRETTEKRISTTEEDTNIYSFATEREFETTTERNNRENVKLLDLLTAFDSLPFSLRPDFDSTVKSTNVEDTNIVDDDDERIAKSNSSEDSASYVEVGVVEEILKDDIFDSGNLKDTNISRNYSSGGNEDRKISSKVRPSIIASGAILGLTIVVFLAIFIVCRIRQKQKYTYRNTFSRAVFQGPAMTARKLSNSSSLNTIMVNVVATSTTKRPERRETQEIDDDFEFKSDIENDSLDANDSWETIPDFMK